MEFYSSSIFQSLGERKCMFLLCNGILAFLAKNLNLNTSARDNFDREDCLFTVEYDHNSSNASEVPEEIEIKVQDDRASQNAADEIIETEIVCEDWNEDEDEDGDEDDEDEDGDEDDEESEPPSVVSDMRVSTEELNKKFDEFIRKMKEEIRIEARQQYLIVV
ncbi:glutamic acid-rich protein-like [Salvia splendens]|uniref:glutamic acid-rich protein-like n=1 Tax=Salvia splendens TaxID=180675 RepID=UPI001C2583B5|nr:glutamic acid-rich protein-like [Salvia splendens]